jgi:phage major head subunit gpT-like protein
MGAQGLSSRAIIGRFYQTLTERALAAWVGRISALFESNQESETYKWLGMVPAMRQWIGGREAKGFRESGMTIVNKEWEATLEVLAPELRRDKTGQINVRIDELAARALQHWNKLLSLIIDAGAGNAYGLCYDGQYFFDTDHQEGDSGIQSNAIEVNITTPTAPSAADMETAIMTAVSTILGFKDDQNEPMNEDAVAFDVMVPLPFFLAAASALKNPVIIEAGASKTNLITNLGGFGFQQDTNPRLSWTTEFAVFRTDGIAKPLIRQEEEVLKVSAIAEGSEEEFKNNRHLYGVKATRNVGYGYWQHACKVKFI